MSSVVEIRLADSKEKTVVPTVSHERESFRKAAISDLLASVQMRDEEAKRNSKDCFKRPIF